MIYKYRSFDASYKYDVFTKRELYFSSPSEFNDPFESKPHLIGLDTLKERQKIVNSFIKRECQEIGYKEKNALRKKILIRLYDKNNVKNDLYSLLNSYGIYSAASKWYQCLMWSHYSDSHKGFCIGFDFDSDFDNDVGMSHIVKYVNEYPKLHPDIFDKNNDGINNERLVEVTLGTKSIEWEYEEEIRYIKIAREGGSGIYKFQGEKVKEVIVGACASDKDKNELIRVVKKHMPWVEVFQTQLSDSMYELYRVSL